MLQAGAAKVGLKTKNHADHQNFVIIGKRCEDGSQLYLGL